MDQRGPLDGRSQEAQPEKQAMIPFYLKKWYFDLITSEGDALYFYFITARVAGFGRGIASAHLVKGDGQEVRAIEKTPFAAADASGGLKLGRHAFFFGKSGVEARLEFRNLTLNVAYAPRVGPWRPAEKGVLLTQKGRIPKDMRWHVPVPSARVEGVIAHNAGRRHVSGDGYVDVVETDIPAWRLPLAELQWGRAHFAGETIVFNQIKTRQGAFIRNLLLTETAPCSGPEQRPAFDEQSFHIRTDPHDALTSVSRGGAFRLTLTGPKIIEQSRVVTAERFKSKPARRLIGRLTGNPQEKKMVSRARLEFNGKTISGTALHERVSWHWPEEARP
jgi:hypothetical protein